MVPLHCVAGPTVLIVACKRIRDQCWIWAVPVGDVHNPSDTQSEAYHGTHARVIRCCFRLPRRTRTNWGPPGTTETAGEEKKGKEKKVIGQSEGYK